MVKYTFPKKLRLLTPSHFSFVFQKPKRTSLLQVIILGRLNSLGYPRVGLTISRKNIKRAHDRNRIKRLIRESFRLHQHNLSSMDFVLLVKKGVSDLDNYSLLKALEKLWHHYYCSF